MTATFDPEIVDTEDGGREQHWSLPTDEDSLLRLIRLLFDEYWNEMWFGLLIEGSALEVAAPNAPKKISMYDGDVRRVCNRRLRSLAFSPVHRRTHRERTGARPYPSLQPGRAVPQDR
ncbi:hypothetical protein [Rhodococcus sp. SMB37]|uniref:DUF7676 family protein n=1 Tax=Rhodococcus sp. SMB37 TaxID=2512213 RepID=UPI001F5444E3|nr:hypothetical protein [Rhodococcus sp. SMB37]